MPKRARKDLDVVQDKRARVVQLRGEGKTWDEIARLTGYSNGSAASKAWKRAIQQHTDLTVDEVRRQEKTRLEQMDSELSRIISSPPIRSTSIGRVMYDPRTCECGAGNTPDHEPGCPVEPVLDLGQVTSAIRTRLALGESLRKLTGADAPAASTVAVVDNSTRILAEINQFHAVHPGYRRTPGGIPPGVEVQGPAAITAWKAEQARRAAVGAQDASCADIVEAEIVEEDP